MFKDKFTSLRTWEAALLIALSVCLCAAVWAQGKQESLSSKLLRLHVIAVSDDEAEQELKLQVRDAVLRYISPKLQNVQDVEQAKTLISSELDGIRQAAESVSQGRSVSVSLSRESYPSKSYEGFSLPAGKYESLRITLGEGKGQNWWCIVFPPVCLSASQGSLVEQQLGRDEFRLISTDDGYCLKFRALELWGELTSPVNN